MKTPCQYYFILPLLHFFLIVITASDIQTKDWPCPLNDEFLPCICTETADSLLDVDCSAAKTEEQLAAAFATPKFSFTDMNNLLIDHTGCPDCSLEILQQGTFGPVSFRNVQIHGTALAEVIELAFENSHTFLEVLDLSGNRINSFTFEVIEAFTVLETLNLKDNALNGSKPLPDVTSASLKYFYLSNNLEVVFGPNVFSNCLALEDLQLSNISLTQIPQIDQDLTSMFYGLLQLKSLDLSNNILPELASFSIDTGEQGILNNVYLHNNSIDTLHLDFITNEGATGQLDMSNNQITLLEEVVWRPIFHAKAQETINLQNNPLRCGCEIAWLVHDPELMAVIDPATTCKGGNLVVELPEDPFANCDDPVKTMQ